MVSTINNSKGFSLVELLVVMGILAILAGALSVATTDSPSGRFDRGVGGIVSLCEEARQSAIGGNTYVWVLFGEREVDGVIEIVVSLLTSNEGVNPFPWLGEEITVMIPHTAGDIVPVSRTHSFKSSQLVNLQLPTTPAFSMPVGGVAQNFDGFILFTPSGEARVSDAPVENITLQVRGTERANTHVAEISISGLTGRAEMARIN